MVSLKGQAQLAIQKALSTDSETAAMPESRIGSHPDQ